MKCEQCTIECDGRFCSWDCWRKANDTGKVEYIPIPPTIYEHNFKYVRYRSPLCDYGDTPNPPVYFESTDELGVLCQRDMRNIVLVGTTYPLELWYCPDSTYQLLLGYIIEYGTAKLDITRAESIIRYQQDLVNAKYGMKKRAV